MSGERMPGFAVGTGWLNSPPLADADLRGRVVLVDFWTYTCVNWLRTLGYVRAWAAKYRDCGLLVVGVHTPEFPFERDPENVSRAVAELDVPYAVVLDSDYAIWDAFANHYWPAVYVAGADGRIRHHQFGEGGYEECERSVQRLLREGGQGAVPEDLVAVAGGGLEAQADWTQLRSPETYLDRQQPEVPPERLYLNQWSLQGEWTTDGRASVLSAAGGSIAFRFHARDVNLVLRPSAPEAAAVPFTVSVGGHPPGRDRGLDTDQAGRGEVVEPRLYQLVRQSGPVEDRTFEITFLSGGVEAYVFTFG
jgi:hypothetical protein